jgi:hypothetical protein
MDPGEDVANVIVVVRDPVLGCYVIVVVVSYKADVANYSHQDLKRLENVMLHLSSALVVTKTVTMCPYHLCLISACVRMWNARSVNSYWSFSFAT